jgi:hypothetical protein
MNIYKYIICGALNKFCFMSEVYKPIDNITTNMFGRMRYLYTCAIQIMVMMLGHTVILTSKSNLNVQLTV